MPYFADPKFFASEIIYRDIFSTNVNVINLNEQMLQLMTCMTKTMEKIPEKGKTASS